MVSALFLCHNIPIKTERGNQMFDPTLNQQMAQLDQEYAQKKANLMQNYYRQPVPAAITPQPTPKQNVNWIQVSGVEGARNHIVQPGNEAWLMDNNAPYFYVKSVDGVGKCTFRIFHFDEVADVEKEQTPQIDPTQYVQRGEFDDLKALVEQYTTQKSKPVKVKENDNG